MASVWFREELAAPHTGMQESSFLYYSFGKDSLFETLGKTINGWWCISERWAFTAPSESAKTWAVFKTKDQARAFIKGVRGNV
jgi:hypothetical protein